MYYNDIEVPGEEEYGQITSKIVKRHFPRNNNEQVLDFVFEKDKVHICYIDLNKIIIKYNTIEPC